MIQNSVFDGDYRPSAQVLADKDPKELEALFQEASRRIANLEKIGWGDSVRVKSLKRDVDLILDAVRIQNPQPKVANKWDNLHF